MSNTPLSSFASAATGPKPAASNVKLSSAELLSMLKKPTSPTITTPATVTATSTANSTAISGSIVENNGPNISISFKDDDYTLQGLVNLIKACQANDRTIYALGVDLENDLGLPMNQLEPLKDSFISPWFDDIGEAGGSESPSSGSTGGLFGIEAGGVLSKLSPTTSSLSASLSIPSSTSTARRPSALDTIIPTCYHVPSLPAPLTKITSFADETLFYIFYAMPGDKMQELAARELFSRGWRFYKPSKAWLCPVALDSKEGPAVMAAFTAAQTTPAPFFLFDQSAWIKVKRSLTIQIDELEFIRPQNSGTASPISSPEIMHGSGTLHSTSVTH